MADALASFIHRHLPGTGPRVVLALHGTGGDENDLIPLVARVAPGAAVLAPRGRVVEQGMARFFRRTAPGVFDLDDLRAQTADLAAFVHAAADAHRFRAADVLALGYSNGANIAAALALLHPGTVGALALLRAMVPLVPQPLPDLAGLPVWMASGRADPLVPEAEATRLARLLEAAGARVRVRWAPGGHQLAAAEIAALAEWFAALPGPLGEGQR